MITCSKTITRVVQVHQKTLTTQENRSSLGFFFLLYIKKNKKIKLKKLPYSYIHHVLFLLYVSLFVIYYLRYICYLFCISDSLYKLVLSLK